jgi:NAD(P)-dependent dehydrogenase (short-subunit alcohol dehydrogenase family)
MANTVLITGANRGIGLALAKEYLRRGDVVLAACRRPDRAAALDDLQAAHPGALHVIALDIDSDASCAAAGEAAAKAGGRIDVLINNAAVGSGDGERSIASADLEAVLGVLRTNVLGALRVTRAMLNLVRKGENPRIVNISSGAGRITGRDEPGMLGYGSSKAALNFATVSLAAELKPEGIVVIPMSPGWVKTDMGGPEARIEPAESAAGIAAVIDKLTLDDTGLWYSYDGTRAQAW